jgi:hypothetical protein
MVHPGAVARAFAVAVLVALAATVASAALFRSWHRGALIATGSIALLASKYTVVAGVSVIGANPAAALVFAVATVGAIALAVRIAIRRRLSARAANAHANVFLTLLMAVTLLSGLSNGLLEVFHRDLLAARDPTGQAHEGDPNMYVLLLDAYPRADVLRSIYDFDNAAFLESLASRDFHVATDSRSNYWFTSLSLATLFYGKELEAVPDFERVISGREEPRPSWRIALSANPMFEFLHRRGYRIAASASGWSDVDLRSADIWLDSGSISNFESSLLRSTFIADVMDVVAPAFYPDQKRDRIDFAFRAVEDIASRHGPPTFTWIHVPAPHPPVALAADGTVVTWPNADAFFGVTVEQMGIDAEEYERRFTEQLAYVNSRILESVDVITREDPGAVVIVMSDHGPGNPEDSGETIDYGARLHNLFAARTPGHEPFSETVTPINVLRVLCNTYFGTDLAVSPDTSYSSTVFGTDDMFMHLEPLDESDLD